MLKAVLLDAYGTLLNTGTGSVDAAREILARNKREDISPNVFYARWKQLHREHMRASEFAVEEEIFHRDLRALYAEYGLERDADEDVGCMLATLGRRAAFPETKDILEELKRKTTVCIASTTDTQPLLADMRHNDLHVHRVFTSESLRVYKPDRVFYRTILRELGIGPQDALFVGDSLTDDVHGPQSVGMCACWVNRKGASPGEVRPDFVIEDLKGLPPIVNGLL